MTDHTTYHTQLTRPTQHHRELCCVLMLLQLLLPMPPPLHLLSHVTSRGSYISRLLEQLPRTTQTTVAFCRTLVVAHCDPTPMTCGSCSCREHVTNSVIGVSRPPVLDCGTTFHLDYGGKDLPSTPSDNL